MTPISLVVLQYNLLAEVLKSLNLTNWSSLSNNCDIKLIAKEPIEAREKILSRLACFLEVHFSNESASFHHAFLSYKGSNHDIFYTYHCKIHSLYLPFLCLEWIFNWSLHLQDEL